MQRYQNAAPASREFKIRLVELVAAGIHQMAAILLGSDHKVHTREHIQGVVPWKEEPERTDALIQGEPAR